jgi:transposase
VKVLCCDEIAPHKGHGHYQLVIYAPELGIVLDLLADRLKESLERWFDQRGAEWCAQVEVFCADMWDGYHQAAVAKLPNARQVVDHFHVIKNLSEAVSKTRRTIQKQLGDESKVMLKNARWLLLKNPAHLSDEEKVNLDRILAVSPELSTCYQLKEDFRQWFNKAQSIETAATALDAWLRRVYDTPYKALHAFADTVTRWRERILNFFDGRYTNAFAEGVNLKIKLILRRGFG